jgi:xanthine dehydrogenase YagR molybdenum-binding subunit
MPAPRSCWRQRPLGTKGLGELTAVSVAPAIANAVYRATGKRVRDLPITVEQLLLIPRSE